MTASFREPDRLHSPSGADLALYSSLASTSKQAKAKAAIHVNHGMAEHSARYERIAKALNAAGYHVYAQDHRGHGKTQAPNARQGSFSNKNGFEKVLQDVLAVNKHIREQHPDIPVIMFGHSMGSIIALNFCIRYSKAIEAALLFNSGVDTGALFIVYSTLLKMERLFKGSDVPSNLALKLTFESWNKKFAPNRTEFDWLSRDTAEVDKYVADPLCGFATTNGLWLDVLEGIRAGADDTQLAKIRKDLPFYLIGGEADPCTDNGKAMTRLSERLRKSGVKDVTCRTLADTRHETLNEINREEETSQLIKWLEAHFGEVA